MKLRPLLFTLALVVAAGTTARANDSRFSQTLTVGERTEAGLNRLSDDQIAVIDALVRRDLAAQASPRPGDPQLARFSQRLTPEERTTAGLGLLDEKQIARLDALLDHYASATLARVLLAPPVFVSPGMRLRDGEAKTAPEIHGSLSLSYGFGKGGYNEKTGAMILNYDDPTHGFSVTFGYSESEIKGPGLYRNGYLGVPPFVP